MESLVFAAMAMSNSSAMKTLMLFESLRTFGGELADYPCIALIPGTADPLSDEVEEGFSALSIRPIPFNLDEEAKLFPFAAIAYASAEAEEQTKGKTEILVWMHTNTLVVNPPTAFLLPRRINYAHRPVHHTLIASIYEKPLDDFWSLIYQHCGVTEERVFPMETCVRDNTIRPYFNAGLLVLRPERGLLSTWRDCFERLYRHPDFESFYEQDMLYRVFMHQAVLAGVVLNMFAREELLELPEAINYPLNLHDEYPPERRPKAFDELITCRYESIKELLDSLKGIPAKEPLKSWLTKRLEKQALF